MRGSHLIAVAVAVVLAGAAGCSDPAGAERQQEAAARAKSPSPTASSKLHKARPKEPIWRQDAGMTKTDLKAGLKVKAGHLFDHRVTIVVTDTKRDIHRTIVVRAKPVRAYVGRYLLSAIKVTPSGIAFAYRLR